MEVLIMMMFITQKIMMLCQQQQKLSKQKAIRFLQKQPQPQRHLFLIFAMMIIMISNTHQE